MYVWRDAARLLVGAVWGCWHERAVVRNSRYKGCGDATARCCVSARSDERRGEIRGVWEKGMEGIGQNDEN